MDFLTRKHIEDLRSRGYEEQNLYSEPAPELLARAGQIITEVTEAFQDVRLGAGVGLFEGQAIDDYETDSERALKRSKDEKEAWWNIPIKDLNACHSSLSFFDPMGMRFHLPAFICCDLRGELELGLDFNLSRLDGGERNRFSLLSETQKKIVATYLEFLAEDISAGYSRKQIIKALDDYWRS